MLKWYFFPDNSDLQKLMNQKKTPLFHEKVTIFKYNLQNKSNYSLIMIWIYNFNHNFRVTIYLLIAWIALQFTWKTNTCFLYSWRLNYKCWTAGYSVSDLVPNCYKIIVYKNFIMQQDYLLDYRFVILFVFHWHSTIDSIHTNYYSFWKQWRHWWDSLCLIRVFPVYLLV